MKGKSDFLNGFFRHPGNAGRLILSVLGILALGWMPGSSAGFSPASAHAAGPAPVTGTLEISITDYENKPAETTYRLIIPGGETVELHPATELPGELVSGTLVTVQGNRVGRGIHFDTRDDGSFSVQSEAVPATPTTGQLRAAVVMLDFDDTRPPKKIDESTVSSRMNASVDPFYIETSFGQTSFISDAFGWFRIGQNHTCDLNALQALAVEAADPVVDFSLYTHLIVYTPYQCSPITGRAFVGNVPVYTQDGTFDMGVAALYVVDALDNGTAQHEVGHTLGLNHSGFLDCLNFPLFPALCQGSGGNGDRYDTMGIGSNQGHFNAPHKEALGWFSGVNFQEVTTDGTFTLEPIEAPATGLQAIRIPRPNNLPLWVEYRQPIGLDAGFSFPTDVFDGALLHFSNGTFTDLIDGTSPPYDSQFSSVPVGQSFRDPFSGHTVTVVDQTASALTVNVMQGSCTEYDFPTVSIVSPANNETIGGVVTITAEATDTSGISRVEFYQAGENSSLHSPDLEFLGSDSNAPFQVDWDTTTVAAGKRRIFILGYDNRPLCDPLPSQWVSNVIVDNGMGTNVAAAGDLLIYRLVTEGQGKDKRTVQDYRTDYDLGDEIIFWTRVVDAASGAAIRTEGTLLMQLTGPMESPTPETTIHTAVYGGFGVYTVNFQTELPSKKSPGTPTGTYEMVINDVAIPGYTWDGVMKNGIFTVQ